MCVFNKTKKYKRKDWNWKLRPNFRIRNRKKKKMLINNENNGHLLNEKFLQQIKILWNFPVIQIML